MALQKMSTGAIIATILTGLLLTLTTGGLLSMNPAAPTTETTTPEMSTTGAGTAGTVTTVNVGVYSDSDCTQPLTSIDWGTLSPGASTNKTVHVKNKGTAPLTVGMKNENWNPPEANGTIIVTWDKEGAQVNVNQTETAVLTLAVSPDARDITTFSVDIIIVGTG